MISPCLTRRLCLTTRLMRALPSSRSSSAKTIKTVSLRFLPLTRTVSPRNSWRVSIVLLERAITELSSLTASVTLVPRQSVPNQYPRTKARTSLHEGVRLLLLLQDSRRGVEFLFRGGCQYSPSRSLPVVQAKVFTSFLSAPEASLCDEVSFLERWRSGCQRKFHHILEVHPLLVVGVIGF